MLYVLIGLLSVGVINYQAEDVQATLQAPDWRDRAAAFHRVVSSGEQLSKGPTQDALVALLVRENELVRSLYLAGDGASVRLGEEYSEYHAELLGTVASFATAENRQALEAVGRGAYNPHSALALKLARFGEAFAAVALDLVRNGTIPEQWNGLNILGEMLRLHDSRGLAIPLSANSITGARTELRRAAQSTDFTVRLWAVRALGKGGRAEDIPLLTRIAHTDPDESALPGTSVRGEAQNAIRAIERRGRRAQ